MPILSRRLLAIAMLASIGVVACSGEKPAAPPAAVAEPAPAPAPAATPTATPTVAEDGPIPDTPSPYADLPEELRAVMDQPSTADFDGVAGRRMIRAGVTFNRTHYFIDKGQQLGLTYESLKLFEDELNKALKTGNANRIHVVFVPMPRSQLGPSLLNGKIDLIAAMVTVTPERESQVAFTEPTRTDVSQVVVTGPGAPPVKTPDDLSGHEVFVRKGSLYYDTIVALNEQLKKRGKAPVVIDEAPDVLEDDDVLEMVNAGLVPATLVDDYLAEFWVKAFPNLTVHHDVALRSGGTLAVAVRKNNPKLVAVLNDWIRKHGKGDAFRNTIERRYLVTGKYARNAAADKERRKFEAVVDLFKKNGARYNVDYLLMAAQGYQESTLDQSARNPSGAVGVMQVLPSTAKDLKVGDITKVGPNVEAGVKYMRFMMDDYFANDPMDDLNKALMSFAAYNAGPGRLRQLRRETEKRGLNPNIWFGNVERIASERIGRETVQYVSNIYKYYVAYRLVVAHTDQRAAAKAQLKKAK